jgi:hypothetical protein
MHCVSRSADTRFSLQERLSGVDSPAAPPESLSPIKKVFNMEDSRSFNHPSQDSGDNATHQIEVTGHGTGYSAYAEVKHTAQQSCDGSGLLRSLETELGFAESCRIDACPVLDGPEYTKSLDHPSTNRQDSLFDGNCRDVADIREGAIESRENTSHRWKGSIGRLSNPKDYCAIPQPATPKINGRSCRDSEMIHAEMSDVSTDPVRVSPELDLGPPSLDLDSQGYWSQLPGTYDVPPKMPYEFLLDSP